MHKPFCVAQIQGLRRGIKHDSIIWMAGFFKFWGEALWRSFRFVWAVFAVVSTLLPAIISLIHKYSPPSVASAGLIEWVAENQAELQCLIAASFLLPYLLYAPYRLYKEQGQELSDLKSRGSNREISERLGEFLAKGEHWKSVCRNPKGDIFPGDRMAEWGTELESYVVSTLGQSYHARLVSSIGITDFPVGVPEQFRGNWIYINV